MIDTAHGICGEDKRLCRSLEALFAPAAKAYIRLYKSLEDEKEFFGLRDFYAFIKTLVHFAKPSLRRRLNHDEVEYAVLRNFDGFPKSGVVPRYIFMAELASHCNNEERSDQLPPESNTSLGILYFTDH